MPKLLMTSAPTVYSLPSIGTRREAEPMPPLRSIHTMPVPPPTAPSAKTLSALLMARCTSSSVRWQPRMSFSSPSLHSITNADLRIFVYGAVDQCIQRRAD